MRLQGMVSRTMDKEFKMFMRWRGINIDNSIFELKFNEPQNFASYTQADIDGARLATFAQVAEIPYISKRFALKRYMDMTEEEIAENAELWREEQGQNDLQGAGEVGMRSVGVTPGGIEGDIDSFDELEADLDDDFDLETESPIATGGAGAETAADAVGGLE